MREYLKPSMLILSCESFGAKLQGSGASLLVCSGTGCDADLGASCHTYQSYYGSYVQIYLVEEGLACPTGKISDICEVTALTINGSTASTGMCYLEDYKQCDTGCGISIVCDSMYLCSSLSENEVHATVACSGFSEPVSCNSPI